MKRPLFPSGPLGVLALASLTACVSSSADHHGSSSTGSGGAASSSSSSSGLVYTSSTGYGGEGGSGGSSGDSGGFGGDWGLPIDQGLVAIAGDDLSVYRGQSFYLDGYQSSMPAGDPITGRWSQVSGEPVVNPFPNSLTFSGTAPDVLGPMVFRLRIRDNFTESEPDDVTVNVVNRAPLAWAGPDRGGLAGETVTLEGAGHDLDGDALTYRWTQVSGPAVALSSATAQKPTLVVPAGATEPMVFALTVNDGLDDSAPDWVTAKLLTGPDSDGDLLEDAVEVMLGTDPTNPDTDGDGIPDGWEVFGHEGVDYAGLGCDPLHKDLLVELDYEEYVDQGVKHSAHPTPQIEAALEAFYAGLALPNPDGAPGIALHLVDDSVLPQGFSCVTGFGLGQDFGTDSPPNFAYRDAFHKAAVCIDGIAGGISEIGGRRFALRNPEPVADPETDEEKQDAFTWYVDFLHEMGHDLGVRHGGFQDLNYKPNYPSLMNYAYSFGLTDGPMAIDGSTVGFSHGLVPSMDECAVVEKGIFAGVPKESLAFLPAYQYGTGWTVTDDGSVDWNKNGSIDDAPYMMAFASGAGGPACEVLRDNDDYATLLTGMPLSIPAGPKLPAPFASDGHFWPRAPEVMP